MKVSVHCEGTPKEISQQLSEAAKVYAGKEVEETSAITISDIKAKRGKGKKAVEPEEVEEDETDEIEADDETETEVETDEEDFETEDEAEDEEDKLSDSDLSKLKAALKAYSAKNDKKKAVAILNKFAERSDLVKPADLSKLLKLLKV